MDGNSVFCVLVLLCSHLEMNCLVHRIKLYLHVITSEDNFCVWPCEDQRSQYFRLKSLGSLVD